MIGKSTSGGRGFHGLVRYLMDGSRENPNPDRVAWAMTRNLLNDDPDLAIRTMRATASRSTRCEKPVYHLVISWRHDENPTDPMMWRVADTTLADLGLDEHQALYVAHKDTDHRHLHIVLNRIHPDSHKAWNRGKDWPKIEISLRRQAEAMGLAYVPGRHNDPEAFGLKPRRPANAEYQSKVRHGEPPPAARWGLDEIACRRRELAPLFEQAGSWGDLSALLAVHGVRLERKGQGLILLDDMGSMKLSEMGKSIRLRELETRFNETFDAFAARVAAHDAARPAPKQGPVPRPLRTFKAKSAAKRPPQDKPFTRTKDRDDDAQSKSVDARQDAVRPHQPARPPMVSGIQNVRRKGEGPGGAGEEEAAGAPPARPGTQEGGGAAGAVPTPSKLRHQAHDRLADARRVCDLAYRLHSAGVVTDAQLAAAKDDLRRAQLDLWQHLSMQERLEAELREALRPAPQRPAMPPQKPKPTPPDDRPPVGPKHIRVRRPRKGKGRAR